MILNRSSHQRCSWKFRKFHMKIPVPESLFNKVAGLRPATLLKKRLWHKCFPMNFAKFLRTLLLQNSSGWLLLTKLHDPNRKKNETPLFWVFLRWLLNGMNMSWHFVLSFLFFLFRNNFVREQLDQNDFHRCYVFFSKSTWSQLCLKLFINNYEATWHLTFYCMLVFHSNKLSF